MITEEEVMKEIDATIDSEIRTEIYEDMVILNEHLSDAVTVGYGLAANYETIFTYNLGNSREEYILRRLGHIAANPSRDDKKDIFSKVYVMFSKGTNLDEKNPNANDLSTIKFLENLINASDIERKAAENDRSYPRKIFVLTGLRGVGKTFFINYLFSEYNQKLTDRGIIWVRINLPEEYGGDTPNVLHWLLSKVTLVIFRYYLKHPKLSGLLDDVSTYVNTLPSDLKESHLRNLQKITEIFVDRKIREKLHPELVEELIARNVLSEAIKRGFSFIFILDGFDRVEIAPKHKSKFNYLLNELDKLTSHDTRLGGCYLIVSRKETLEWIWPRIMKSNPSDKKNDIVNVYVEPSSFEDIVTKRIAYIRQDVPKLAKKRGWDNSDWPIHIDEFEIYLINLAETKTFKEFILGLDRIFGVNHRAKVQLTQLAYHSYLLYKNNPKRYRLVEYMIKLGFKFPPKLYMYECIEGKLEPQNVIKIFDNVLMPQLFRFPFAIGYNWKSVPHAKTYLLCGFRLMQLLNGYNRINKHIGDNTGIPIYKILDFMDKEFGYKEEITFRLLEEFCEMNLLNLRGSAVLIPSKKGDFLVYTTEKFRFLFESTSGLDLLFDVAYLNLCAMRTPLNKKILNSKVPFIRALSLDDNETTILEWIILKIINSISLFRLIRKANDLDLERSELGNEEGFLRDLVAQANFFEFADDLKRAIKPQIFTIVNRLNDSMKKRLLQSLSDYRSYWC